MPRLFTVYQNGKRACGIEAMGQSRHVIHTLDNVSVQALDITLVQLSSLLAGLLREGYVQTQQIAFYSEKKGFQTKHPDFDSINGDYSIYCVTSEIAKAVKEIDDAGNSVIHQPTQRAKFMNWLRSQDMNDEFVVAPKADPEFALFLAEVAIRNGWQLHSARVGMPAVAPSVDVKAWTAWLSNGLDQVDEALASAVVMRSTPGPTLSASTDLAYLLF